MLNTLAETRRTNETVLLGTLSLACFGLSIFRVLYTGTGMFLFLNWNLFLAFVPWALTSIATMKPGLQDSKPMFFLILVAWFLFFPNAPYIFTDLFHLRLHSTMPIWFDLVLILSFAWTGLMFGFLSLWDIEGILSRSLKEALVPIITMALLFISSFGVYVGRFLRWNSWDILTEPGAVIYDAGHRLLFPLDYPEAWGMTIFMGLFLNMIYLSFRMIRKRID